MEEIDKKIDDMPIFNLRDPKNRKQTSINIEEIIDSINLEEAMEQSMADYESKIPPEQN